MNRYRVVYVSLMLALALASCSKESTINGLQVTHSDTAGITVKAMGDFTNGPYGVVTGRARVYSNSDSLFVSLEKFSSSAGPDLKVYLSDERDPVNFVNLGSLRSVTGAQRYYCPPGTVISRYKYVLIYCQQYRHLFGAAML